MRTRWLVCVSALVLAACASQSNVAPPPTQTVSAAVQERSFLSAHCSTDTLVGADVPGLTEATSTLVGNGVDSPVWDVKVTYGFTNQPDTGVLYVEMTSLAGVDYTEPVADGDIQLLPSGYEWKFSAPQSTNESPMPQAWHVRSLGQRASWADLGCDLLYSYEGVFAQYS